MVWLSTGMHTRPIRHAYYKLARAPVIIEQCDLLKYPIENLITPTIRSNCSTICQSPCVVRSRCFLDNDKIYFNCVYFSHEIGKFVECVCMYLPGYVEYDADDVVARLKHKTTRLSIPYYFYWLQKFHLKKFFVRLTVK